MTEVADENATRRLEKLEVLRSQMAKEDRERALERNVRYQWCVEIYDYTEGVVNLPYSVNYGSEYVTQYEDFPNKTVTRADGTSYETPDYSAMRDVNVKATEDLLRVIVRFARSKGYAVKYDYGKTNFSAQITLHQVGEKPSWSDITMNYIADRSVMCEKVTETVHHEAEPAKEAYDEEVEKWDCRKVSFLGIPEPDESEVEDKTSQ